MSTTLQEQARALGDPTRYRIFRYVADAERAVGVAELTELLGLNHNAIRQHLGKLVSAELVTEDHAPSSGRGRPRLVYCLHPSAESRWGVRGPYERLSVLLAEMLRTGETAVEVGRRSVGRLQLGAAVNDDPVQTVVEAMDRQGFDPVVRTTNDHIELVLRHCPFETAALADSDSVCGIHLGMAQGTAALSGEPLVVDSLIPHDPRHANCQLRMHLESQGGSLSR